MCGWNGHAGHAYVEVMVRPHEVALRPAASGPASVVDAEFQGAFVLYTVVFARDTPLVAELAHGHRATIMSCGTAVPRPR